MTKALILAGGLGTRLRGVTDAPKCLVDVGGKPVIEHILWQLSLHDITDVMVNVHYKAEQIMDYLGDRVIYFYEPKLLNTAGTVRRVANWFDDDILVVNGDTINNANYTKLLHHHKDELMDVTVLAKEARCAGAYVIYKSFALDNLEEGRIIDDCISGHKEYFNQRDLVFHDIGTPEKLAIARKYYEKKVSKV